MILPGLRATLRVKPFGEFGAYFPPGQGRAKLSVEHDGKRFKTERKLSEESDLLDNLLQHSKILDDEDEFNDEYLLLNQSQIMVFVELPHKYLIDNVRLTQEILMSRYQRMR